MATGLRIWGVRIFLFFAIHVRLFFCFLQRIYFRKKIILEKKIFQKNFQKNFFFEIQLLKFGKIGKILTPPIRSPGAVVSDTTAKNVTQDIFKSIMS